MAYPGAISAGMLAVRHPERWVPGGQDAQGRGQGLGQVLKAPPMASHVLVQWAPDVLVWESVYELDPVAADGKTPLPESPPHIYSNKPGMCKWDRVRFERVPGYVSGYGCPECKGLNRHLMAEQVCRLMTRQKRVPASTKRGRSLRRRR